MIHTQQFIEDAIAGGFVEGKLLSHECNDFGVVFKFDGLLGNFDYSMSWPEILMRPGAWKAVGRTRGWGDPDIEWKDDELVYYRTYMHRFLDHLCDGLIIDAALGKLTS